MTDDKHKPSILLVDDESEFLEIMASGLGRAGFRVRTAATVTEALETMGATPIEVIFSDFNLPGANGVDFLKAVREKNPAIPFFLMTGDMKARFDEAKKLGLTGVFTKPFSTSEVVQAIILSIADRDKLQALHR